LFSNLFILFHPFSSLFFFLKKKRAEKGRKRQKKAGTVREISQLLGIVSLVVLLFESFCLNPFVSILLFYGFKQKDSNNKQQNNKTKVLKQKDSFLFFQTKK